MLGVRLGLGHEHQPWPNCATRIQSCRGTFRRGAAPRSVRHW
jgi:hypothetical protein